MSDSRHIVIVGGGIIGTSIAYYLSRTKGAPAITLLESSKGVAPGASGKAGGFLALDWHGMATSSLAALSYKLHRDLAKENNGAERWGYREVEVRFYFFWTSSYTDAPTLARHLAQAALAPQDQLAEPQCVHLDEPDWWRWIDRPGYPGRSDAFPCGPGPGGRCAAASCDQSRGPSNGRRQGDWRQGRS